MCIDRFFSYYSGNEAKISGQCRFRKATSPPNRDADNIFRFLISNIITSITSSNVYCVQINIDGRIISGANDRGILFCMLRNYIIRHYNNQFVNNL